MCFSLYDLKVGLATLFNHGSPGCRPLSSIYEEANHPLTLDLGVFILFLWRSRGNWRGLGTLKNTSGALQ